MREISRNFCLQKLNYIIFCSNFFREITGEGDTPFFTPRRSPFAPLKEKIKILESSLAESLKDNEDLKAANEFLEWRLEFDPSVPLKKKIKILESSLAESLKDNEDLKAANEFLTKKKEDGLI